MSISTSPVKFGLLFCAILLWEGTAISQQASDDSAIRQAEQDFSASIIAHSGARLTSEFGIRRDPFSKKKAFHSGIDIGGVPVGTHVHAPANGEVVFAGNKSGYGNMVDLKLSDSGHIVRYGQLSTIGIETGDEVRAGTVLGGIGSTGRSTGPHLHLEYLIEGQTHDPQRIFGLALLPDR